MTNFIRSSRRPAGIAATADDWLRIARPGPAAVDPTEGDDVIDGTTGDDVIHGLGGNDTINGLGGSDMLDGGAGNDILNGGGDWDWLLVSGVGIDIVHGGSGILDTLSIDYRDAASPLSATLTAANPGTDGYSGMIRTDSADRSVSFDGIEQIRLLAGGANDVLHMGASRDEIRAGDGQDEVFGGDGDDDLRGEGGDDWLRGEGGDDVLIGDLGDDRLEGGSGRDLLIEVEGGNDEMLGGDGDDRLSYSSAVEGGAVEAVMDGGAGDDFLNYNGFGTDDSGALSAGDGNDEIIVTGGGDVTIHAGAGADFLDLVSLGMRYTVSLGTGSDLLVLRAFVLGGTQIAPIIVTDFGVGDGADALGLDQYLSIMLVGWERTANPFASGHLALVQRGADAVVRIDFDGAGAAFGLTDLVVLQNVAASGLTARNLGGWAADGSAAGGQGIAGSSAEEILSGTSGDDVIAGFDADDRLYGASGDDRLEGGAGADLLDGAMGDDRVFGGDGGDRLVDPLGGSDQLFGEGGDDFITVDRQFAPSGASLLLDGGADTDNIAFYGRIDEGQIDQSGDVTLRGGAGHDAINVVRGGRVTIDGGAGTDQIQIDLRAASYDIIFGESGEHPDTLTLFDSTFGPITSFRMLDFTAGSGGDVIRMAHFLDSYAALWDPATNPFATGFLRLAQSGADALILIDRDGGGDGFALLGILKTIDAAALNEVNLGFVPGAIARAAVGTDAADSLVGTSGHDLIVGLAGNDLLSGGVGQDRLIGGRGGDRLIGGEDADTFVFAAPDESQHALRSDGRKALPDMIEDFVSGEDRIDLSGIDAVSGNVVTDDAFAFIGTAAFSGEAGELRFEIVAGRAYIEGDLDGNGLGDFLIVARTALLQAGDFIL